VLVILQAYMESQIVLVIVVACYFGSLIFLYHLNLVE
jgi:hypothetical protein